MVVPKVDRGVPSRRDNKDVSGTGGEKCHKCHKLLK